MSSEERKTKLQEIKEKLEKWNSSLPEMKKFIDKGTDELRENLVKTQETPSQEENELYKEIKEIERAKKLDFIDNWEKGKLQPNEEDIDFLEEDILLNNWRNLISVRNIKKSEEYERDEEAKKSVDAWEEDFANLKPYWEKVLSLKSQYYLDKKKTSSSSNTSPTNSKTLPWTLAIIFGITTIISAGIAIYFFLQQRKIRKFKT
ncbi:hypothetical protein [endosymbiont GvMRE of Glomus versiforme]|uniref:hypothetical protein n=1 Tax=endosymbiont GvMRE of Glomus versiforme TaxID=2039283 RepID=UPI000ECD360D|nr:hypothetical protein [endosymbiont GvMRE of Glomus versiforme]RHZ36376.1 hypothetical protein GvMRE_Ic1g144 [endosymbiont GvMRE of Glomus versiforme]